MAAKNDRAQVVRQVADSIVRAAAKPTPSNPTLRMVWASVVSIQTTPHNSLTIKVQGASTTTAGIRYDASYSPTVGDTVWGLWNGADLVVLGKLA